MKTQVDYQSTILMFLRFLDNIQAIIHSQRIPFKQIPLKNFDSMPLKSIWKLQHFLDIFSIIFDCSKWKQILDINSGHWLFFTILRPRLTLPDWFVIVFLLNLTWVKIFIPSIERIYEEKYISYIIKVIKFFIYFEPFSYCSGKFN